MFRNFANNENDYSEEILNLSLVFEFLKLKIYEYVSWLI